MSSVPKDTDPAIVTSQTMVGYRLDISCIPSDLPESELDDGSAFPGTSDVIAPLAHLSSDFFEAHPT